MSADAESQVTSIIWAPQERELLTAHGYSRNHLSLWKYPSLVKSAELEGHSGRILDLAQSPDGSLVCSVSADETLRFWQMFSPSSKSDKKNDSEKNRSSRIDAPNPILRTIR
jgi:cell division cycle protein 20 (cofactor of APC complex)